jgi:hypothetical protein
MNQSKTRVSFFSHVTEEEARSYLGYPDSEEGGLDQDTIIHVRIHTSLCQDCSEFLEGLRALKKVAQIVQSDSG